MYVFWLCFLTICFINIKICISQQLNLENIKIWGTGLNPEDIVMPARYFFIDTGTNNTLPSFPFDIQLYGINKHNVRCRVWQNILDRKDGSYIIRYKIYETCYSFKIEITYEDQHVGDSPYKMNKPIYAEECYCPKDSFQNWIDDMKCDKTYRQIDEDLKLFDSVDFNDYRTKILAMYNKPTSYSICNYVVFDNKVYRKCYGKYVGFNMFMDSILLSLTRKVQLPNLEFFVNLGDWPLASKGNVPLPIFSWCGSEESYDIVMPTYDITESTLENMGRVMLDMLSVQGNIGKMWEEKIPKVFWRGRDSNRRRLDLIDIAKEHPDLFNVSLTNFFFYRNEEEKYGPKAEHVSFFKFYDYKYQLNIDGTVAAYRFPYLLAGDSLVFKQDSIYYEWFYHLLKPNEQYIQVNENLSNLMERLNWAINHDDEAQIIAKNAQEFSRKHLMPVNVFCYYAVLLSKWSEKLQSDILVRDGMELVPQPNKTCECLQPTKDEL